MGWFTSVGGYSPDIPQSFILNSDFFAAASCECSKYCRNNKSHKFQCCSSAQTSMVLNLHF